jgi:hypothetical protein
VEQVRNPWISPYAVYMNNSVNLVDPNGASAWKPDEDGNLIAETGDNAWTLAKFQNIKPQEAIQQLTEQAYTINNKGILDLKVGDKVTLDNVYTRKLASHGSLPSGDQQLKYNCWGSALAGVDNEEIQNGVGINMPTNFDNRLKSDFVSVSENNAQFGNTIVRFTESNPYASNYWNNLAIAGDISRDPHSIGGASHGLYIMAQVGMVRNMFI